MSDSPERDISSQAINTFELERERYKTEIYNQITRRSPFQQFTRPAGYYDSLKLEDIDMSEEFTISLTKSEQELVYKTLKAANVEQNILSQFLYHDSDEN